VIISTFQSDYCCCLKIGGKLVQLLIESLIALPLSFFCWLSFPFGADVVLDKIIALIMMIPLVMRIGAEL
jgi:hypothetical protein